MATPEITQTVRSFKFRLLPNKRQHAALLDILESQRQLYNAALEHRIEVYRKTGKSPTLFDQGKELTTCRAEMAEMAVVPANIQRATLGRLDLAYKGFFGRIRSGAKAGFPRFKGKGWWSSFGFAEFSGIRLVGKRLHFKGMPGSLRVHMHRVIPDGKFCSATFKRDAKGWAVSIQAKSGKVHLPKTGKSVGIDMGLTDLAIFDTGEAIPSLRAAKKSEAKMRRTQRALSRCKRSSNNRKKAKLRLTRLHARIANRRDTYLHQVSARIVKSYDLIAIENLNVRGLASGMLAKSVNDAAWSKLRFNLTYKAEDAGRQIIAVDPRNTTQECSGCGATVKKSLSQRIHSCAGCGLVLSRDTNAARNILHRAVVGPGVANVAGCSERGRGNIKMEGISN